MIVVTGGEGFIGKNLVQELQKQGNIGVVVLDIKNEPLDSIYDWLIKHCKEIEVIYHLGAITDTTIMDRNLFDEYNVACSMFIWNLCCDYKIPLIYASSAATYGDGLEGFNDEKDIFDLKPLNPYGQSKQQFDMWAIEQNSQPPYWYGLKFFNVYGYGEASKCKMSSVVFHLYSQIQYCSSAAKIQLFKSHRPDYANGEQKRDFIYVDDVVNVCMFFYEKRPESGIYNVGTGKARSFNDLAKAVFKSLGEQENITYIDTPIKIRDKYQYFTEAKMNKLKNVGYNIPFHELEEGVLKYINKLKHENS
jgi:ADP-L-glycero-D-manno-heptose 6-epimerase